jgi:hypothetical protein
VQLQRSRDITASRLRPKPEDVDDPISVGRCAHLPTPLRDLDLGLSLVEEILASTETERLVNLPTFSSMVEFLTMLALGTGRLLRVFVSISSSLLSFQT